MRIIKGLNKFFGLQPEEVSHEEKIEKQYKRSVKAEEIDDPVKATADYVTEMIKDPTTDSEEILAAAIDSDTPNKVFGEVVRQIAKDPSIPNSTIAKAIDSSNTNVSDETIIKILEGIPFKSAHDRRTLIKNIDDKGIREEQIIYALSKFYESDFSNTNDMDVVQRLSSLYSNLDFDNGDIDKLAQRIVAKQIASMYHRFSGAVMPQRFKQVEPTSLEKMMEVDMPQLVQDEYQKAYPDEIGKFKIELVRQAILRELAIEIAHVYEKTKLFVVPESEAMTKLSDGEIEYFINEIFGKVKLPEKDQIGARMDLEQQIKAQYDVDQHAQRELDSKLNMLSKHEKIQLLHIFNAVVASKRLGDANRIVAEDTLNSLDVIAKLASTGTLEALMQVPAPDRRTVIAAIGETIDKRFTPERKEEKKEDKKIEDSEAGSGTDEKSKPKPETESPEHTL